MAGRGGRALHRRLAAPLGSLRAALAALAAVTIASCAPIVRGPELSAVASAKAETPALVTLAVVTWNLHDGRGDLPRLVDDLSSGRITGQPVRDYVLLLQEAVVDSPGVDALASSRRLSAFHVPIFSGQRRPRGTAIVSTLPLRDVRAIDLPNERQHRVAAAATIIVRGRPLVVVSAHFENRLDLFDGGPFADRARGRQAAALVEALPAAHAIVGGDLNTMLGPSEPALRTLGERFRYTPPGSLAPTFRDRLTLDHLFFDLAEGWTASRQVIRERYGSDHHPVLGLVTAG